MAMPGWLSVSAVIMMVLVGLIVVLELVAVTALLMVIKQLIEQLREHLDPLATKLNSLLMTANEVAETVQEKTERIAGKAEHTAGTVTDNVEKTSNFFTKVITSPVIGVVAAGEGLRRGLLTWRALRTERLRRAMRRHRSVAENVRDSEE